MKNKALISVSTDDIKQLLKLPRDANIIGVRLTEHGLYFLAESLAYTNSRYTEQYPIIPFKESTLP